MPEAATADPILDQLLDSKKVVALACAAHDLSPIVHGELALGEFRVEGPPLDQIRTGRLFGWRFRDEDRREQMICGENYDTRTKWEFVWRSGDPLVMKIGAVIRANDRERQVEALIYAQPPNDRLCHRSWGSSASYLTDFLLRHYPAPHPFLAKARGLGVVRIAKYETLGHGQLKQVRELFQEFAAEKPLLHELADTKISPFRPEKAWGYLVPEALWPRFIADWQAQLRDFKKKL